MFSFFCPLPSYQLIQQEMPESCGQGYEAMFCIYASQE